MVVLGIVIAASLVVALVATYTTGSTNTAGTTVPAADDPNQLIAAATANPNNPDIVGNLANYFDQTGQYQNALVLYQQYLKIRPDDAGAHVSLGELLLASGDTQGAQGQFAQAIALKPTNATAARAHLGLGNAYATLKPPRLSDAISEYQQASALDPTGSTGDSARTRLSGLLPQSGTVTVIAPGGSAAPPPAPPSPPTPTP